MKRSGHFLVWAAAFAVISTLFAADAPKSQKADKGDLSLDGVKCPIGDDPVDEKLSLPYKGGRLFFCCKDCLQKYKKDPSRYAVDANRQLIVTGQAVQVKCPLTG